MSKLGDEAREFEIANELEGVDRIYTDGDLARIDEIVMMVARHGTVIFRYNENNYKIEKLEKLPPQTN